MIINMNKLTNTIPDFFNGIKYIFPSDFDPWNWRLRIFNG